MILMLHLAQMRDDMTSEKFKQEIESINRDELAAKRPIIQNETTLYPWEDQELMPLLVKGVSQYYEKSNIENGDGEKLAVKLANEVRNSINKCESVSIIESQIERAKIEQMDIR